MKLNVWKHEGSKAAFPCWLITRLLRVWSLPNHQSAPDQQLQPPTTTPTPRVANPPDAFKCSTRRQKCVKVKATVATVCVFVCVRACMCVFLCTDVSFYCRVLTQSRCLCVLLRCGAQEDRNDPTWNTEGCVARLLFCPFFSFFLFFFKPWSSFFAVILFSSWGKR